jgi:phosphoribosylanthranilate isomerase
LNPENIADAVRQVQPAALDTASGVESAPGIKDAAKMRDLVSAVRRG